MKLSPTMQKTLNQIIEFIDTAKRFNNYHDYYMFINLRHAVNRKDYEELVERYEWKYTELIKSKYFEEIYLGTWKRARENDIALTSGVSSSTLRALEERGYIEIIVDGRDAVDHVKLLKR